MIRSRSTLIAVLPSLLLASLLIGIEETSGGDRRASKSQRVNNDPSSDGFVTKMVAKRQSLKSELRDRQRALWEGVFTKSGFSPSGWIISRDGYVSISKVLDMGKVEVDSDKGIITLRSHSPGKPFKNNRKYLELLIVPWGKRTYLVEREDMLSFCNAFNSGALQNNLFHEFYIREEGGCSPSKGLPTIPEEYKKYLLKRPIIASIVKQLRIAKGVVVPGYPDLQDGLLVTVNSGSHGGLRPGMKLYWDDERFRPVIYVIAVSDHTSSVLFTGMARKDHGRCTPGARISSNDPLYTRPVERESHRRD